ncbi:MAG: hypothetical protein P1U32_03985 [Legionellaceae bacterium]|nr:hypothetical protein [Legionellaceae bacterium]
MSQSLKHFFQQLPPFILLGVAIALAIGIFVVFSYVLVWGLLIGAVLWGVNSLIQYVRGARSNEPPKTTKGRVIDHDRP